MKKYQLVVVALVAFFLFGCSQIEPTAPPKNPGDVLKTLNEASKTKDVAAIKNSISKGTLAMLEDSAKAQNTTVDELLKKDNGTPFKDLPEMRGEKIAGDTATIELKNANDNSWEIVPFVKEDGAWRLALDKYLEDFKKRAAEDAKMPAPSPDGNAKSESDAAPNAKETANKSANKK